MRSVTVMERPTLIPRTIPMSISPARFTAWLALLLALACLIAPPALAQPVAGRTIVGGQPDPFGDARDEVAFQRLAAGEHLGQQHGVLLHHAHPQRPVLAVVGEFRRDLRQQRLDCCTAAGVPAAVGEADQRDEAQRVSRWAVWL